MITDRHLYEYIKRRHGAKQARLALTLFITSDWIAKLMLRTFSNSIEASLLIIALRYFDLIGSKQKVRLTMPSMLLTTLITTSFVIRNSSAVVWIPLLIYKVFVQRNFTHFLLHAVTCAIPILMLSIAMDSVYYGRWTLTSYNFVKFNFLTDGASHFGTDPWWQYLVVVLPS